MKVHILPEVHAQIMYYVNKSNVEISGLGRIEKSSDGSMVVTKIYLLEQENTAASTDIDAQAMAKLMYQTREDKGNLNFWWHSHVNMATFWSGTDMATIKQFGKNGYLLSTVFNKKGEFRTSYFQGGNDFLPELFIDNIETVFSYIPKSLETTEWEAEFNTKCKSKTFAHHSTWADSDRWSGRKDYFFDDWQDGYDYYSHKASRKGSKLYGGKGTLLTGEVGKPIESVHERTAKNFAPFDSISVPEFSDWQELLGMLKGKNPDLVDLTNLENFYNAWKGDFESAEKYVCDKLDKEINLDALDRAIDEIQGRL